MTEPLEIERKFKVNNFVSSFIPPNAVIIKIEQNYLVKNSPGVRRIRKSTVNGATKYFYTEKIPTGKSGTRIEREKEIGENEYSSLLAERDPNLHTIQKTRYCFNYAGNLLELDVFTGGKPAQDKLILLEIELENINDKIEIPPRWEVEEVTDNHAYSNNNLAAG